MSFSRADNALGSAVTVTDIHCYTFVFKNRIFRHSGRCLTMLRFHQPIARRNPFVTFEVFTAMTMKNGVFSDVTPCGSCKNRRFGETSCLHHQGDKNRRNRNNVSNSITWISSVLEQRLRRWANYTFHCLIHTQPTEY
jgi:hypothetical protein